MFGHPAARGSIIRFYATGLGATSATATAETPLAPLSVTIGGVGADGVQATGAVGIFSIDARVPDSAPPGAAVALLLTAGDAASQSGVTVAVR